jgi:hypothetical protein
MSPSAISGLLVSQFLIFLLILRSAAIFKLDFVELQGILCFKFSSSSCGSLHIFLFQGLIFSSVTFLKIAVNMTIVHMGAYTIGRIVERRISPILTYYLSYLPSLLSIPS